MQVNGPDYWTSIGGGGGSWDGEKWNVTPSGFQTIAYTIGYFESPEPGEYWNNPLDAATATIMLDTSAYTPGGTVIVDVVDEHDSGESVWTGSTVIAGATTTVVVDLTTGDAFTKFSLMLLRGALVSSTPFAVLDIDFSAAVPPEPPAPFWTNFRSAFEMIETGPPPTPPQLEMLQLDIAFGGWWIADYQGAVAIELLTGGDVTTTIDLSLVYADMGDAFYPHSFSEGSGVRFGYSAERTVLNLNLSESISWPDQVRITWGGLAGRGWTADVYVVGDSNIVGFGSPVDFSVPLLIDVTPP